MKKSFKKLTSLALALCLTVPMAVAVSAKEYINNGYYNGSWWGVHDACEPHRVYAETGSTYDDMLKTWVIYFCRDEGQIILGGTKNSTERPKSAVAEVTDTRDIFEMSANHYMNGAKIDSVTITLP